MAIQVQLRRGTTAEHAPFVGAVGEVTVDTTKDTLVVHDGVTAGGHPLGGEDSLKSISVENPTNAEDISFFFTEEAITISKMVAVLVGSAAPSVTWTIRHGTDRSLAGAEVVTGGTTTTSVTTGSVVTTFNDATIPANSFVWLETTAKSGTVNMLQVTLIYSAD